MENKNIKEDLAVWFGTKKKSKGSKQPKGPWVNICRKDKDGKHPPCGRSDSDGDGKKDGAYPKCRAVHVAAKMSADEKKRACQQKRRAEKNNPKTGKGNKPTMVSHKNLKENMNTKIIKLTEKDLYRIVENIVNGENKKPTNTTKSIEDIAKWSEKISKVSGDDFRYIESDRYRFAVDSDNEYLGHWDHKISKGFIDEIDLVPNDVLVSSGINVDDKEYDYIYDLNENDLLEGKKEGKSKKSKNTLCSRGKSAAKAKFEVYPSAYANGYAVQVCKGTMPGLDGKKRCSGKYCKGNK